MRQGYYYAVFRLASLLDDWLFHCEWYELCQVAEWAWGHANGKGTPLRSWLAPPR